MTDGLVRGPIAPGTVLGERYRLDDLIGRGGMAVVYRAHDVVLGRDVAIKVFGDAADDDAHAARAATEVRVLASLNHHSLVTLFDARVSTGEDAYLVMELVDGPTLRDRIASGPLDRNDIAAMAVDLSEALAAVHAAGMVHRDVKPSNVLLAPALGSSREFRAKLADFGIAHLVDSARLTTPGTIMGTAAYLSPEQTKGVTPAPAGDVYSLGLVLLESFTRERAFPGGMTESLVARVQRDPFVPGDLGYGWKSLLTSMTARSPENRPTALEVAESARSLLVSTGPSTLATIGVAHDPAPITQTTPIEVPFDQDDEDTTSVSELPVAQPRAGAPVSRRSRRSTATRTAPRSRRRLAIAAAAVLVAAGLGTGFTSLMTGGAEPVSASDTEGGSGTIDLATLVGEFNTGFDDVLTARKAAAAESEAVTETAGDTVTTGGGTETADTGPTETAPVAPAPEQPAPEQPAPEQPAETGPGSGNGNGAGNAGQGNGPSKDTAPGKGNGKGK